VAGATLQRRLTRLRWLRAEAVETVEETPRVRTIVLDVPGWSGHRPGQHLDVRLTAEDGYQAQRSYSLASAPEDDALAITVELVEDGEVSGYLVEELRTGDAFEVRGPIGGYFVWEAEDGGPVLLVAGGSGVVPFRSMLRHRVEAGSDAPVTLVVSARTAADLIYREELERLAAAGDGLHLIRTLTRGAPPDWEGPTGRVSAELLAPLVNGAGQAFVCGPTGFVETVADLLVDQGLDPARVKTERFGPTGG
jgi:ferredoxin-NADP reductase